MNTGGADITALLARWRAGEDDVLESLMPLVYGRLRDLARSALAGERRQITLQPTSLVNELYLKLCNMHDLELKDRGHFMAVASRLMRQILVDHARRRNAAKRDGGARVTLTNAAVSDQSPLDVIAVDEALTRLESLQQRHAKIVELRLFAGLTSEETAQALGISRATVTRSWRVARAWLVDALDQPA